MLKKKGKFLLPNEKITNLSPEQERILLKDFQEGKKQKDALSLRLQEEKDLTDAEKKEINKQLKLLEQKISRATRLLIYYNQHLVKYIARGYFSSSSGIEYEDLVAEGIFSLPKAIGLFDLNSSNRFATYAGYWIHQKIQAFFSKNQLISQGSEAKNKRNIVYYDDYAKNEEKENKSYSIIDRLDDSEDDFLNNGEVYQRDTEVQVGELINSLSSRDEKLVIRLYYRIIPRTLLDIYNLLTEEEKSLFRDELSTKKGLNLKENLEAKKKYQNLPIIKQYLDLFGRKYTISELAKTLKKPDSLIIKIKKNSFQALQEKAKGKNLHILFE